MSEPRAHLVRRLTAIALPEAARRALARNLLPARRMREFLKRFHRGSLLVLALLVAGGVALADLLFFDAPVGWSAGLFGAALAAAVLVRPGRTAATRGGRVLVVLLGGLVAATALQRTTIGTVLLLTGVAALALVHRGGWFSEPTRWARRLGALLASVPVRLPADLRTLYRRTRRAGRRRSVRALLLRWLVPFALASVFVALFTLANPIIEGWLAALGDELESLVRGAPRSLTGGRILLWLAVSLVVWALLRVRTARRARPAPSSLRPPSPPPPLAPSPTATLADPAGAVYRTAARTAPTSQPRADAWPPPPLLERCLALFNLVFAVQTVLDVLFLVGGAALPEGTTFAAYAHRGAYPLVATALLSAAFVLVTFRAGSAHARTPRARRLVYAWVAQNVFLVCTAAWRLALYMETYGLTRLRLAAALWMLLVAAGLFWIVARIAATRTNAWLVRANALTALGLLYACSFVPLDSLVAWHNVRHCAEVAGGERVSLDLRYLHGLGPDALPALVWVAPWLPPDGRTSARVLATDLAETLRHRLHDPRGWTWRDAYLLRSTPLPASAGPATSSPGSSNRDYHLVHELCASVGATPLSRTKDYLHPGDFPTALRVRAGGPGFARIRATPVFDADDLSNQLGILMADTAIFGLGPRKSPDYGAYYVVGLRDPEGTTCLGYVSYLAVEPLAA